jgi:hypothetical protein
VSDSVPFVSCVVAPVCVWTYIAANLQQRMSLFRESNLRETIMWINMNLGAKSTASQLFWTYDSASSFSAAGGIEFMQCWNRALMMNMTLVAMRGIDTVSSGPNLKRGSRAQALDRSRLVIMEEAIGYRPWEVRWACTIISWKPLVSPLG